MQSVGEKFNPANLVSAITVVGIVLLLIVPVPAEVLDVLLTFNIAVALIVVLMSMAIKNPLEFSVFPTMLLVATLFRLSLDVSATRMILLCGDQLSDEGVPIGAGSVIPAFGHIVIGGNVLVGIIVFLILIVIQFMVITSGAERIAQVAARFTLDAMPLKQMAIDQDMQAGIIDAPTARQRRKDVERSSDFYGAMDGAGRFVKGDSMAAVVIMVVNLLGGVIMGVGFHDMTAGEAFRTYALLSIGNGLATTVPAFLMSTSMAMIVTRAASDSDLSANVVREFTSQPLALLTGAGFLVLLGLLSLTGRFALPPVPFLLMGCVLARTALVLQKKQWAEKQAVGVTRERHTTEQARQPVSVIGLLQVEPLLMEVGRGLLSLVDPAQEQRLLERVTAIRRHIAIELGIVVPGIRFRDNLQLKPNAYAIRVKDVEVAQGEVMINQFLAIAPEEKLRNLRGVRTTDPTYHMPAIWIGAELKAEAERLGCMLFDPVSVVATQLTEVIRNHAAELLGYQDVQALLDNVKRTHPAVVRDLVPDRLSLGDLQQVLQNLLRERVSIRDLVSILETMARRLAETHDPEILTECVRAAMARIICRDYVAQDGQLNTLTLDPGIESMIAAAVQRQSGATFLALDPTLGQAILHAIGQEVARLQERGFQPILLCSPAIRPALRKLTDEAFPNLVILSWNEIAPRIKVNPVAMISVS